jgi:hypothetical protein
MTGIAHTKLPGLRKQAIGEMMCRENESKSEQIRKVRTNKETTSNGLISSISHELNGIFYSYPEFRTKKSV